MAYGKAGPLKISEASYNKQNRKMRKENPTMGSKLTSEIGRASCRERV